MMIHYVLLLQIEVFNKDIIRNYVYLHSCCIPLPHYQTLQAQDPLHYLDHHLDHNLEHHLDHTVQQVMMYTDKPRFDLYVHVKVIHRSNLALTPVQTR